MDKGQKKKVYMNVENVISPVAMMSTDIGKLAEALSKFQGSIGNVAKNKTAKVGSYSYKYADLADIWSLIRTPLATFGLSIIQTYEGSQIITILAHSSGQWIKSSLPIGKLSAKIQELGSEITYLRRYALSSILGIAADDDEDGEIANEIPRQSTLPPPPVEYLTYHDMTQIDLLLNGDMELLNKILIAYNVQKLSQIQRSHFETIVNKLKNTKVKK